MLEIRQELGKIIPYQELLGNYDGRVEGRQGGDIIPYQELLGNYDYNNCCCGWLPIIPYQSY